MKLFNLDEIILTLTVNSVEFETPFSHPNHQQHTVTYAWPNCVAQTAIPGFYRELSSHNLTAVYILLVPSSWKTYLKIYKHQC